MYESLKQSFADAFHHPPAFLFSAPGRTELGGNHTDHQLGRVLAGAVSLDTTAAVARNGSDMVQVLSEGYPICRISLSDLEIHPEETGSSAALIRGILSGIRAKGCSIPGFDAYVSSRVLPGSGLSSSAAFEVLIGTIVNHLSGCGLTPLQIAQLGQSAENVYFGKPCGLMDQLACSLGHTVYVDFKTNEIVPLEADFEAMGLTLCLTDTGGSHAGLDSSYARIPADMVYVANLFDKGVLGDVDPAEFRAKGWDPANRPVRRAMHFFDENERVPKMRDALIARNGEEYMRLMNASGRSSEELLNNIVTSATGDTKLAEGLEKSRKLLEGRGAWRVHGGGFAGCVQALMPSDYFPVYKEEMEKEFGKDSCRHIRLV